MRLTCRDCGRSYPGGERGGHCTVCHESFRSDHLFDRHRVGRHEPAGQRRCLTETEMQARGWVRRDHGWSGGGEFPVDKVRAS